MNYVFILFIPGVFECYYFLEGFTRGVIKKGITRYSLHIYFVNYYNQLTVTHVKIISCEQALKNSHVYAQSQDENFTINV